MLAKFTLAAALSSLLLSTSVDAWSLQSTLSGSTFFNAFSFFTSADPTHGFVKFVSQSTAQSTGLTYLQNNQVIIKADNTTANASGGRNSVRIVSNASYNSGLFILDLVHMPTGCGTWPAFWMVGPNWPNSGEIDIIEGVNLQSTDALTLHTNAGCSMAGVSRSQTGSVSTTNCDVNASGQSSNSGCGVSATNSNTYGSGFNNNKGGVYATQWTSAGISIWFFPRSSIPSDINNNAPNPAGWGTPVANFPFGSNCPSSHFAQQQIVFDLTFCGDWAGNVYSSSGCPSTCNAYVQSNPSAFNEAYWRINSLKIYQ